MITLVIKDETMTGNVQGTFDIQFDTELVTIKDIIEARVRAEVAKYNSTLKEYFYGLVQPTEAERTLNGYKMKERKTIDAENRFTSLYPLFNKMAFLFWSMTDKRRRWRRRCF
jgi:hypothetical protein